MNAPVPDNESERLAALHRYQILDTGPERAFDDVSRLAAFICDTPVAFVSLIDRERQWLKSKLGITTSETPREDSLCGHTILQPEPLVVEDLLSDARFASNPFVTEHNLRFYAGAPLLTPERYVLGSVCVADMLPRKLSEDQKAALEMLSRTIVTLLELRRTSAELADALSNAKTLSELLPICAYCKNIRDDSGYWQRVEAYMHDHTDATFSHSICPDCMKVHFPDIPAVPGT